MVKPAVDRGRNPDTKFTGSFDAFSVAEGIRIKWTATAGIDSPACRGGSRRTTSGSPTVERRVPDPLGPICASAPGMLQGK